MVRVRADSWNVWVGVPFVNNLYSLVILFNSWLLLDYQGSAVAKRRFFHCLTTFPFLYGAFHSLLGLCPLQIGLLQCALALGHTWRLSRNFCGFMICYLSGVFWIGRISTLVSGHSADFKYLPVYNSLFFFEPLMVWSWLLCRWWESKAFPY